MKKVTNAHYAKALYEITRDLKDEALDKILFAFANRLKQDRRLPDADSILEAFVTYAKKMAGVVSVEVTTKLPLETKLKKQLKEVVGKEIDLTERIETSLLGGIKVRLDNTIYDATVDTQLVKLKQLLTNN